MDVKVDMASKENEDLSNGLTTEKSLRKLCDDIEEALNEFKKNTDEGKEVSNILKIIWRNFSHKNTLSLFRWSSLALILIQIFALLCISISDYVSWYSITEVVFLILYIIVNSGLTVWETKLRQQEIWVHAKRTLRRIQDSAFLVQWSAQNYPGLNSPFSPCITLQWTKRDGNLVNLPWSLLVQGDIIYLRPGQKVPGQCRAINTKDGGAPYLLSMGEIYSPFTEGVGEGLKSPKPRKPLEASPFVLQETPYISNLGILLKEANNRPVTFFNKQGFVLFARLMEFILAPIFAIMTILIGMARLHKSGWDDIPIAGTFFQLPIIITIPLVPLAMPVTWILLTWFGTARIQAAYNHERKEKGGHVDNPFEDTEMEASQLRAEPIEWKELFKLVRNIAKGTQEGPIRSTNLLHVLSSVTNLCCVDKKGILSWPNPTAEKLFFLRNKNRDSLIPKSSTQSTDPSIVDTDSTTCTRKYEKSHSAKESECVIMTLSHVYQSAFSLQFDDPLWQHYLYSLKPLGLNILLNTCNPATHERYTQFSSHITCEAMYNEDLVPVSQRRCLCELANQMGFTEKAIKPFRLEHQLCTFRHEPPDMPCKDQLAQSLMTTKLKFPFPHSFSVLMRDIRSGRLELMSQGTGDIVLDSCTDYWDGYDVCSLTDKDRKKILDFYHRTSLSAYCTAFAYRPTTFDMKEELTNFYLELPLDPTYLYQGTPAMYPSTETLFRNENYSQNEENGDIKDSFRLQCKQIFIGMVAMQYQAKADVVNMIEQLDAACIRFVHFSKENELRSRVFSEKMGLESGWNCHISLLSDRTRLESGGTNWSCGVKCPCPDELDNAEESHIKGSVIRRSLKRSSITKKNPALRSSQEAFGNQSCPSASNIDMTEKFEETSQCSQNFFNESDEKEQLLNGKNRSLSESHDSIIQIENCDSINNSKEYLYGTNEQMSRSSFRSTSSYDQSALLNLFDLSNRANLPKGIENVRPHLKDIDNVPLQVSLFTDCTTPTTTTMLEIMQEYTEVIVLLGSTANAENMQLFMKADLSLGVEPLYPQVCMQQQPCVSTTPDNGMSPTEMARRLNSIPCSLFFHRDEKVSLPLLITESRNYMQHFMNCFQFWACCNISISVLILITFSIMTPPILSSGDVLYLVSIPIPLLSVSLMFTEINLEVMKEATSKNEVHVNAEAAKYIAQFYISRFLPSILVVAITACIDYFSFCEEFSTKTGYSCDRFHSFSSDDEELLSEYREYSGAVDTLQKQANFQLTLYICLISISFVHKMNHLWVKPPCRNIVWTFSIIFILLVQALCTFAIHSTGVSLGDSLTTWLIVGCWSILVVVINELIRFLEIMVNVRYQKRARLEFGTKLGMNSPF